MTPSCHNRDPFVDPNAGWYRTSWDKLTFDIASQRPGAKPILRYRWPWFTDRCTTWEGVGIGKPTAEYPTGTPYPIAHGWSCAGCRWMPA